MARFLAHQGGNLTAQTKSALRKLHSKFQSGAVDSIFLPNDPELM